jgi:hypothetical protein
MNSHRPKVSNTMKNVPNPKALLKPERFPQLGQKIMSIASAIDLPT